MKKPKLDKSFFGQDVLDVARQLPGKYIGIKAEDSLNKYLITEVEAYRGEDDLACHASKGRTNRNEIMYHEGGKIYVYLIYGMYWMLNFVTGEKDNPQAVLIRGLAGYSGPGILTRNLGIDKTYYGEDVTISDRIWIEDNETKYKVETGKRIGIDYSGEPWISKPWRFYIRP